MGKNENFKPDVWLYSLVKEPKISDADLEEMLGHIRFLYRDGRVQQGFLSELSVEGLDPRKTSYIWDVKGRVGQPIVHQQTLGRTDILTFHTYGHPSLFKPSIAEVLAWIRFWFGDDWRQVGFYWMDQGDQGPEAVVGQLHWARGYVFPVGADQRSHSLLKQAGLLT